MGLVFSAGCSSSVGPSGSHIVHGGEASSLGFKSSSLVDISLFNTQANVAAGVETQILQRLGEGDQGGQWRAQALLGMTHMPRREESFLGYEAFLAPGAARYYHDDGVRAGFALGAQVGFPMRLSGGAPPWKADDLVGLSGYLVPSIGANWFGFETLDVSASLSIRVQLWSAVSP